MSGSSSASLDWTESVDWSTMVDWIDVQKDPWAGVNIDLNALHAIVCQFFRLSAAQCGPAVTLSEQPKSYACVYSFQLPTQSVVARLVAPVKPLFKTESEVAAMDYLRCHTGLPVPIVYVYCSQSSNPVGAEWLLMEHMPGVELGEVWDQFNYPQKQTLACNLVDFYDELFRLKVDGCGGLYHSPNSVDGFDLSRTPRWLGAPLSAESLCLLRSLCSHSISSGHRLGPIHDLSLINFHLVMPTSSQTRPVFSTDEYVKLISNNGNPPTRNDWDLMVREKCLVLIQSIQKFYRHSPFFGSSAASDFRFSHGDLHDGNVLVDPQSGAITGIIDWDTAAFRPSWATVAGFGWFQEDAERFIIGTNSPNNFENNVQPEDPKLRAFFHTELYCTNPDLFSCFLGGVEFRAILAVAADDPLPASKSDIFFIKYHELGYWQESRRGEFPWDMYAWRLMLLNCHQLTAIFQERNRDKVAASNPLVSLGHETSSAELAMLTKGFVLCPVSKFWFDRLTNHIPSSVFITVIFAFASLSPVQPLFFTMSHIPDPSEMAVPESHPQADPQPQASDIDVLRSIVEMGRALLDLNTILRLHATEYHLSQL
ncbi:hypothetical protein D9757_015443 [Collybiopsis confluens]|uniref:Aminoglycoside phosphotransferase domain-containing protein n=1 Tax=Collybiopsis confluens TaxID=2823264 RepID=A0A8H5C6W4_9AGAR|nr:hypothetical protein D9757_015443 [Collybiopsis confluens]